MPEGGTVLLSLQACPNFEFLRHRYQFVASHNASESVLHQEC